MKKNATQQKKTKDSKVPSQTAIYNGRFELQNHKRNMTAIGLPGSISHCFLLQCDWGFAVASWTKEAALCYTNQQREERRERPPFYTTGMRLVLIASRTHFIVSQ